jgi:hypothetical protein
MLLVMAVLLCLGMDLLYSMFRSCYICDGYEETVWPSICSGIYTSGET